MTGQRPSCVDFENGFLYITSQMFVVLRRSSLMQLSFLDRSRLVAQRLRLHGAARALYNAVRYAGAIREIQLEGIACRFSVTSGTLAEHVEGFCGEKDLLIDFIHHLNRRDVVWDVGASFGMYSIVAGCRLGAEGRVVAFEPEPVMRLLLEGNIHLNKLDNVTALPYALIDLEGETTLYPPDNPNVGTGALVQRQDYRLRRKGMKIQGRRADVLVAAGEVPPPTVLKIDVEGAERRVLDGFGVLLKAPSLRAVYCEVHPKLLPLFGHSVKAVEETLTQSGFHIASNTERGTERHIICLREI